MDQAGVCRANSGKRCQYSPMMSKMDPRRFNRRRIHAKGLGLAGSDRYRGARDADEATLFVFDLNFPDHQSSSAMQRHAKRGNHALRLSSEVVGIDFDTDRIIMLAVDLAQGADAGHGFC